MNMRSDGIDCMLRPSSNIDIHRPKIIKVITGAY